MTGPSPDPVPAERAVPAASGAGPGRLRGPVTDGYARVQGRWIAGWHLAFWAVMALGLLQVVIGQHLDAGGRTAAAAVLVVLGLAYALGVQAAPARLCWPPYLYLALAIVGSGFLCRLDSSLTLILFIVYPQTWILTSRRSHGVVATTLLSAATLAGLMSGVGWSEATLREIGPQLLVGMLFSIVLGMWIWQIIEQSRERGQLLMQIEATRSELAEAHRAQGAVAERERMAREIHDTLAQGFTSIVMHAQAAAAATRHGDGGGDPALVQTLATIEAVARENLAEARALVAAFAPVGLDGASLSDAIRRLAERFAAETGLEVDADVVGCPELDRSREVVLLRAAQEALTNVRRHAGASRVVVRLLVDSGVAGLEIRDDGVGFARGQGGGGFGLAGMRGRVADVGGDLDVASTPGGGTSVTVRVPAMVAAGEGLPG